MASPRLSTAGMTLQYAVETSAGTRPTTGYTKIPEVKSMPSFNPSPNTIDSTTLEETEYMTYVQGLKDLGGALEYGANLTEDLIDAWDTLMGAYDTAVEGCYLLCWNSCSPWIERGKRRLHAGNHALYHPKQRPCDGGKTHRGTLINNLEEAYK